MVAKNQTNLAKNAGVISMSRAVGMADAGADPIATAIIANKADKTPRIKLHTANILSHPAAVWFERFTR